MVAPPFENPMLSINEYFGDDKPAQIKFNYGTTCLAFKFKGGVIVATDSRATAGGYIASQIKFNYGTTCLAFKFKGGLIVATD